MANSSIYDAFERMWQHILIKINSMNNADRITSGVLDVEHGGTGYSSIKDTTYTTPRYRASALYSSETTPTTNGVINWTYE